MTGDDAFLQSRLLTLPYIAHGFGNTASVQLSRWRSVLALQHMVPTRQVHGTTVAMLDDRGAVDEVVEADAFISSQVGVCCMVRTADCVPILIADPVRRVVAAIHAGWRGTAQNIVAETMRAMTARYGSNPADCRAAIGPAIRACCYPVGEEVVAALSSVSLSDGWCDVRGHVDLVKVNFDLLMATGIPQEMIEDMGVCTCCDLTFSSYRRDGERAGRQLHYILLTGA